MTLEEYKLQAREIVEIIKSFNGTQDELMKLSTELEKKYPELSAFNKKAMDCNNLKDFTEVADLFGIKFSSNESKQILFDNLQKAAKANKPSVNGELNDDALEAVTGGMSKTTADVLWYTMGVCTAGLSLVENAINNKDVGPDREWYETLGVD